MTTKKTTTYIRHLSTDPASIAAGGRSSGGDGGSSRGGLSIEGGGSSKEVDRTGVFSFRTIHALGGLEQFTEVCDGHGVSCRLE